jgi:hypothetical protein
VGLLGAGIADRYGQGTADFVALQLEYSYAKGGT